MKYHLTDTPLKLREYGRNVQSMVEYALTLEDRDQRTVVASEIVRIMSNLNPSLKENPDYKQKLWDSLFIISGFELDVDSPYPIPEAEVVMGRPEKRMDYYRSHPRYRQYGVNVELMVKAAIDMEEGPKKTAYLNMIANTMKLFLRASDRDSTPEEVIAEHIRDLSSGKIKVKGEDLTISKVQVQYPSNKGGRSGNKRSGRGGGKRRRKG
ncbi:DUF4290 domain-containing protein [Pontibacter sp. G13]|uniref:DUF4290 domain-containing protein n=1 Tax=Pontibacter sp. G13 TaxID=3074898 RepID=UPI00288A7F60|nr:DUF4290 domain-containing protein [Pontibacter sp. G13]WNJ21237.1 DUF4290 domain-containing protein [Pontibacter sp. G13]